METKVITIKELAAYLKMAEKTLYRLSTQGAVTSFKVGGPWCLCKSKISKWSKTQEKLSSGEKKEHVY